MSDGSLLLSHHKLHPDLDSTATAVIEQLIVINPTNQIFKNHLHQPAEDYMTGRFGSF